MPKYFQIIFWFFAIDSFKVGVDTDWFVSFIWSEEEIGSKFGWISGCSGSGVIPGVETVGACVGGVGLAGGCKSGRCTAGPVGWVGCWTGCWAGCGVGWTCGWGCCTIGVGWIWEIGWGIGVTVWVGCWITWGVIDGAGGWVGDTVGDTVRAGVVTT